MGPSKKANVPLDEALAICGSGLYTTYVIFATGFLLFASMLNIEAMAMVLPAAGCDLKLSNTEKGMLTSTTFTGMVVAGPLAGFLSDAYGRKKLCAITQTISTLLLLLSSVAPNHITLMAINFVNGIVLTGSFTPAYVFVSEFSPQSIRAKGLIIATCISLLSNIILPGLAWLVLPLEMKTSIFGFITFTSWRLYIIIISIPMFISVVCFWRIPETPKFLLNKGDADGTLEILKKIYAVNNKMKKEDFPVLNVVLDSSDEGYGENNEITNPFLKSVKDMISRSKLLFSKEFVLYTLMSCILLFSQVGSFYSYMLWFPEQLSRIKLFSTINEVYNVTLCDLMSSRYGTVEVIEDCQLNYDFFFYCILLGIVQVFSALFVSVYADRLGKKLLLACILISTGIITAVVVFLTQEYLTIAALGFAIVDSSMGFPLIMALIMEYYPTYVRSTATAVAIIFGRLGAAVGSQIMGALFDNYCEPAYFGICVILIASGLMCLVLPSKRKRS
ncbi:synaptic vesicle glycoprotein 2B isoform X2 [Halyomorpha halys]|uniref:synaptic vesicle glycoprotein 2B isoform X2 n=1 Tax=Halyomorpha halys TaxID=286706 RepID=UPI0006D50CEB|nr:synaptic vesicle glycoprotein 2B-like isoform X1 [Halyomorpha halys]